MAAILRDGQICSMPKKTAKIEQEKPRPIRRPKPERTHEVVEAMRPTHTTQGHCCLDDEQSSTAIHDIVNHPIVKSVDREVRAFLSDVGEAFQHKEEIVIDNDDGELVNLFNSTVSHTTFSIPQLRKDLKRLCNASKPMLEAAAAGLDLLLWVNPVATQLLVLVYMYSIYTGHFFALILNVTLLQLTFNYIKAIYNVDIGINLFPRKQITLPKFKLSSGLLIVNVAKLTQSMVKFAADVLEKMESLFTWKRPDVTWHFYYLCIYWLMWTMCFSYSTCFIACAMTFGIRLFITTYLFHKFPRLRYRLDTYGYFYRNLPVKSGENEESPKPEAVPRPRPSSNPINIRQVNDALLIVNRVSDVDSGRGSIEEDDDHIFDEFSYCEE